MPDLCKTTINGKTVASGGIKGSLIIIPVKEGETQKEFEARVAKEIKEGARIPIGPKHPDAARAPEFILKRQTQKKFW